MNIGPITWTPEPGPNKTTIWRPSITADGFRFEGPAVYEAAKGSQGVEAGFTLAVLDALEGRRLVYVTSTRALRIPAQA